MNWRRFFQRGVLDAEQRKELESYLDLTAEEYIERGMVRHALSRRVVGPDLVHHSDRGSQYASGEYTDLLKENGIVVSMWRARAIPGTTQPVNRS